jgi:hypothetical protein
METDQVPGGSRRTLRAAALAGLFCAIVFFVCCTVPSRAQDASSRHAAIGGTSTWEMTVGPLPGMTIELSWDGAQARGIIKELPAADQLPMPKALVLQATSVTIENFPGQAELVRGLYGLKVGHTVLTAARVGDDIVFKTRLGLMAHLPALPEDCRSAVAARLDDPEQWTPIVGLEFDGDRLSGRHYVQVYYPETYQGLTTCRGSALAADPPLVTGTEGQAGFMQFALREIVDACTPLEPHEQPRPDFTTIIAEKLRQARDTAAAELAGVGE